ncbi:hypothetical protein EDEG_04078 [Edhazardia aedis USNM 41457]|uniref:Uncharacterized protein n=1 Tax=Edhazardia aedis (strain USNM 41457) TaxID=1003232 RepID=J9DCW3_EDHAE|nr:hypothetical protein EDEG_04078 [Edhazardia aedis USNM 41457]|eukprot:EJW05309.1 hypothetical protein EDEG_04078 [Edhazardia aedis USNM 41457]
MKNNNPKDFNNFYNNSFSNMELGRPDHGKMKAEYHSHHQSILENYFSQGRIPRFHYSYNSVLLKLCKHFFSKKIMINSYNSYNVNHFINSKLRIICQGNNIQMVFQYLKTIFLTNKLALDTAYKNQFRIRIRVLIINQNIIAFVSQFTLKNIYITVKINL